MNREQLFKMTVTNVPPNDFKAPPNKGRKKCGGILLRLPQGEGESDIDYANNPFKECKECHAVKRTSNAHCENYVMKTK